MGAGDTMGCGNCMGCGNSTGCGDTGPRQPHGLRRAHVFGDPLCCGDLVVCATLATPWAPGFGDVMGRGDSSGRCFCFARNARVEGGRHEQRRRIRVDETSLGPGRPAPAKQRLSP